MNVPTLEVPVTKTMLRPKLTITLDLTGGSLPELELSEDCGNCAGYGSPCPQCIEGRQSRKVLPAELHGLIGRAAALAASDASLLMSGLIRP